MKKFHIIDPKSIFLTAVFLLLSAVGHTQYSRHQPGFWQSLRFGGGVGLGFGNNSFNVQLAPSAIYPASEAWAFGLGLNFNYAKFGDDKFTAYGGSLLSLFNPIPPIQLSAEFEQLRVQRDFAIAVPGADTDYWLPALFAGLGYSSGPVTFGLRYDLLYDDERSIYASPLMPFVRFYF